jgi:FlgD Ig-like domain
VYNAAYVHNNLALRFQTSAPVPWLSVAPLSGTVAPQSTDFVTATFDATVVPTGTYQAIIRFFSNDPFTPTVDVPVTLNVGGTGVIAESSAPDRFELGEPRPNPSSASTTIQYAVPAGAHHVDIAVFDVAGRRVRTLIDGPASVGRWTATWDGRDSAGHRVVSGVYFYRMNADAFTQVRKVTLLK